MITVNPADPAKAGEIHELITGWDDDCDKPEWFVSVDSRGGWHTDRVDIPEYPEMLAAIVASILDPDRFTIYTPRTRVALIQAATPWMRRCGLLPQPQTDPLEDWQ